jgi:tryptophan 2,3-dioxygenase
MTIHSEPVLEGEGASDYERYLRTDALLALQKPPGERIHRDELLFQVVHQSSELWLKLAVSEIERATELTAEDAGVREALRLLRRAHECLRTVSSNLHMLDHLSPWEYAEIRHALGHGSGFDSPGFRAIHEATDRLGDAFSARLQRAGLTLVDVYRAEREHVDLYDLAESLIELDELLVLWRVHHLKVVQRVIGAGAIGTQGTPVDVMGQLVHKHRFPELWAVRNELTALAGW